MCEETAHTAKLGETTMTVQVQQKKQQQETQQRGAAMPVRSAGVADCASNKTNSKNTPSPPIQCRDGPRNDQERCFAEPRSLMDLFKTLYMFKLVAVGSPSFFLQKLGAKWAQPLL